MYQLKKAITTVLVWGSIVSLATASDETAKISTIRSSLIGPNASPDFTRTVQISSDIQARWTVYYDIGKIDFYVEARTKGFVGFGISDDGRRADLVIGGVNEDETPYFKDRYTTGSNTSTVDARQDWTLIEVLETSDSTQLWFIRSLNTGDALEDLTITDRETNIVWITGETDNLEGPSCNGLYPVNILDPGLPKVNFERTEPLSPTFTVNWRVNFDTRKVTFDISANTTGYVGFGISKTGNMHAADLITGGVNNVNLTPYFNDRTGYTSGSTREVRNDAVQNWLLISAREENGVTRIRCIRDFDTGDATDQIIRYENTHFIWAIGSSDTINNHELNLAEMWYSWNAPTLILTLRHGIERISTTLQQNYNLTRNINLTSTMARKKPIDRQQSSYSVPQWSQFTPRSYPNFRNGCESSDDFALVAFSDDFSSEFRSTAKNWAATG